MKVNACGDATGCLKHGIGKRRERGGCGAANDFSRTRQCGEVSLPRPWHLDRNLSFLKNGIGPAQLIRSCIARVVEEIWQEFRHGRHGRGADNLFRGTPQRGRGPFARSEELASLIPPASLSKRGRARPFSTKISRRGSSGTRPRRGGNLIKTSHHRSFSTLQ